METSGDERAAAPLVGVLLLVAVAIVAAMLVAVLALTILPQGQPSTSFTASFQFDRTNGHLAITPSHVESEDRYHLTVNGVEVYAWSDDETQTLACLNDGDQVDIVGAEPGADETYLLREYEVGAPTTCPYTGAAARFAFAKVGNRRMPLLDSTYDFTLAIDPDGPTSQLGDRDFATSNPWVYVQRYDRPIEGLGPPAYVVVFPDNVHGWGADWDDQPSDDVRTAMADAYEIRGGNVAVNGSAAEPTNDVYMVFAPGCSESTFRFVRMQGGYNNQILLDGTEMFRTSSTSPGTDYTRQGVDCVD